jgi:hypothetical protein
LQAASIRHILLDRIHVFGSFDKLRKLFRNFANDSVFGAIGCVNGTNAIIGHELLALLDADGSAA